MPEQEMQKRLNLKIKFRESFRPFAPSVLAEDTAAYFETEKPSPYMLLIADVRKERRNTLPPDYHRQPIRDKLYFVRSDVPAITHLDFTARLQTVHRNNPAGNRPGLQGTDRLWGHRQHEFNVWANRSAPPKMPTGALCGPTWITSSSELHLHQGNSRHGRKTTGRKSTLTDKEDSACLFYILLGREFRLEIT